VTGVARRVDAWLFADGPAGRLAALRAGLAVILLLRIATWPFVELAGAPPSLFRPPLLLAWAQGMPPAPVLAALQVAGVGGAVVAVAGSWRGWRGTAAGLRVGWFALLVLGGFKTSTGKILHNDVLLLLVAFPAVLASARARIGDRRPGSGFGWPVRVGLTVLSLVYLLSGVQKLRHSGLAWVFSDNMRWILHDAIGSGMAPTTAVATALMGSALLSTLASLGLLAFELVIPVALVWRRARLAMAFGAVTLHSLTWLTLGLDYWAWSLVAALVLGLSGWPRPGSPPARPAG